MQMEKTQHIDFQLGKGFGFSIKTQQAIQNFIPYKEELALLSPGAVKKRRNHFYMGRYAAKEALNQLGVKNFPILKGENEEPIWPENIVGSISHTNSIALACVGDKNATAGIGIDIEKINPEVSFEISKKICLENELNWINKEGAKKLERLIMVFSAKEATFKTFFPLGKIFFGFHDASLVWNEEKQIFHGRLLKKVADNYGQGYQFDIHCRKNTSYVAMLLILPKE